MDIKNLLRSYLESEGWSPTESAKVMKNKVEYEKNFGNSHITIGYKFEHIIVWLEEKSREFQYSIKPNNTNDMKNIVNLSSKLNLDSLEDTLRELNNISEVFYDKG